MKKILAFLSKISAGILTLVIVSVANSSTCFYFYQPEAPKALDDFRLLK